VIPLRIGFVALIALTLLEVAWHAWLVPADSMRATLLITALPAAFCVVLCSRNMRRGVLVGGMLSLGYFSHGVASAYSEPAARWLAFGELALALVIIAASGWDARGYRRKKPSVH
jgi:uncharacterized membrane protein